MSYNSWQLHIHVLVKRLGILSRGTRELDIRAEKNIFSTNSDDRRLNERTATVFRTILIEAKEFSGFCLVRNISTTGIMGHVYRSIPSNTALSLHFGKGSTVDGSLVWCVDGRVGVRFNQAIDVDAILSRLAAKLVDGKLNRAPRLPVQCRGRLIIGERALEVEVQDVSQRGIKILTSFVRAGDELHVELDGLERRKAVVRWTKDGTAGLHFVRTLSFVQLANWAAAQQDEKLPAWRAVSF